MELYLKDQLKVENFVNACKKANMPLICNEHDGYDHGYFFVGTFIPEGKRNISGAYQGSKYFSYKGRVLEDLRKECECLESASDITPNE